ncbi:MAG: hypothetical protein AB7G75_16890 [Candidatus Binatia bacterium]
MFDASLETTLTQFTQEVRTGLGDQLVSIVLYGSAAGDNFVPGSSDLNTVIIVKTMGFAVLKKLQPHMLSWHRQGFAVPLVIDQNFLLHSRDVFSMEFYDIKEQHHTLWGEDVFATLNIGNEHLRFLAEHEARSRLLRLQALYFERANDARRLRQILLDSLKTFVTLMRHLLRVQGARGAQNHEEVLTQFERTFHITFPHIRRLIAIRRNSLDWPHEPATEFFHKYLEDIQSLVHLIDRLPPI